MDERLLLIGALVSRIEEASETELPPSEVERYASLFGVRRRSLLALLGWLPSARFDGRRAQYPPVCIGQDANRYVRCWSPDAVCRHVVLNRNDRRVVEAFDVATLLHDTPPLARVHECAVS